MKSTRQIDVSCAAGLIVLAIVCGTAALKLVHHHQAQATHHNQTLAQLREQIRTTQSQLHQLEQANQQAQHYRDAAGTRTLPARDLGPFLDQLYDLASSRGITLTDLKHQPPTTTPQGDRIPLTISGRGQFAELHRFLYTLENLDRFILIQSVTLQPDPGTNRCSLSIRAMLVLA